MSLAQQIIREQEKRGSIITDIMSGKYNSQIAPEGVKHRPRILKSNPKFRCGHCNYNFGFNIEDGYRTDTQSRKVFLHHTREDNIWDLAHASEGVTFRDVERWFDSAEMHIPLKTLHDTLTRMLKRKVLTSEWKMIVDEYHHSRNCIVYHAVIPKPRKSKS